MTSTIFLSIQACYRPFLVGLSIGESVFVKTISENQSLSSTLIPTIDELLTDHFTDISQLNGIIVNQGPGAFGSLRVALATANGLYFGTQKPLIGIDGLYSLAFHVFKTEKINQNNLFVSILQAYNKEVYYGLYQKDEGAKVIIKHAAGYGTLSELHDLLTQYSCDIIYISGNGAALYQEYLKNNQQKYPIHLLLYDEAPTETVLQLGRTLYQDTSAHAKKLEPLYIKKPTYVPSCTE